MRILSLIAVLACQLVLSACVGVQPVVPRIERLPEGAAGAIAPAIARPLSLKEVATMAQSGAPANVIIQALRDSRAAYAVSSAEADDLSRQGVPIEVVEFLRWGEPQPARWATYPYPVYAPFFVAPGIYYSRWGYGRYPRHPSAGINLRFGFRR